MKSIGYASAFLFALVCLAACDDSAAPSESNFAKAINQQLKLAEKLPVAQLCWALADNNVDMHKPFSVNLGGGILLPVVPPILAAAQSAGVLSVGIAQQWDGPVLQNVMTIAIKKPEAWDKKSGLCYGSKVVDKIANWTQPVNGMTQVNYHWKIELTDWATTAALNANSIQTEGDGIAILRLTNTGWQVGF